MRQGYYMQKKETVIVCRLTSSHQKESIKVFKPLSDLMREEIFLAISEMFESSGGRSMLKSTGDIYIKPNGISNKPYCYTRPEVVEAVIRYWKNAGARDIYLFENATQGNITRMVYELTGYGEVCRRLGAKQVFLDELKNVSFTFNGKQKEENEDGGYHSTTFDIPEFVVNRLIENKDENLYINLPKLKTPLIFNTQCDICH